MALKSFDPIAVFTYFISVMLVGLFGNNPAISVIVLLGAFATLVLTGMASFFVKILPLMAVTAFINPLVNHRGATVLFVLNNNPITLQAVQYGVNAALLLGGALCWCGCMFTCISQAGVMRITGKLSPGAALMLSASVRYVPLLTRQYKSIRNTQKCLGLYTDGNIPQRIKAELTVFDALCGWALENGIITAQSMEARGYGTAKRTSFTLYRFGRRDAALCIFTLLLAAFTMCGYINGGLGYEYYPVSAAQGDALPYCISYGVLVLMPLFLEIRESIRWKYLRCKI